MPDRALRKLEVTLAWAFLPFLAVGLLAFGGLMWWQIHQVNDNTARLRQNAIESCEKTNVARKDSNEHLRMPLKRIGEQAAAVLEASAANAEKLGHPGQAARTRKVANAFSQAAAEVNFLAPLNCEKLNGGG